MARTISRSEKMTDRFILRCTTSDMVAMKLAAQERGLDVSGMLRMILIKQKVLSPLG